MYFFQSHRSRSVLGVRVCDQSWSVEACWSRCTSIACLWSTLCVFQYMIAQFLFQGQARVGAPSDSSFWAISSYPRH
ncbi:hypothetical protein BJX68DRAFT_101841 [Aspergillus pseudodeflectus]|uniref:Uncharacterized protein n=1 Tax=Aspergillus pseudodeflectus TaxID=176178 RepID=A0ABR4K8V1_9EURO